MIVGGRANYQPKINCSVRRGKQYQMDDLHNKMADTKITQRCVNCGGKNHIVENCPHKGKGSRCFKCNGFGHISKDCKTMDENTNTPSVGLHMSNSKIQLRHGKIAITAIICTGIQNSYIRKSSFD